MSGLQATLGRLVTLGAAGGLLATAPEPALALEYGGWTAAATCDTYYNDNVMRGLSISSTSLPYGDQDLGLNMGLNVGNVFVVTPEVDTWLIASVQGRAGLLLPEAGGAWGSLFSNTVWHLEGGRDAYLLLGATRFWSRGWYEAAEGGLIQPLWPGARGRIQLGGGLYAADDPAAGFTMPSAGLGLDQTWPGGTSIGVRWAYQALGYTRDTVLRHQVYGIASQPLGRGWELHLQGLRTFDDTGSSGYVGTGLGYEF